MGMSGVNRRWAKSARVSARCSDAPMSARPLRTQRCRAASVLVLTDVVGATPCNVAQRLVDDVHSHLLAGVNLPMLLRAWCYRAEPLDALAKRALAGATQGVMRVDGASAAAPKPMCHP